MEYFKVLNGNENYWRIRVGNKNPSVLWTSPPRGEKPTALLDLPSDFWAVQLVAVSSKEALEKWARDNKVIGMSAARIWNGQQMFYILLLGIYETHENAEEAIESLQTPFGDQKPWVRSLGSLQAAMIEADRESGTSKI